MSDWKILCRGSRLFKEIIFVCFDVCCKVTNVKDNACSIDFGVCLRAWLKVCQGLEGMNKPYWVPTKLTLGFHPHLFSWAQEKTRSWFCLPLSTHCPWHPSDTFSISPLMPLCQRNTGVHLSHSHSSAWPWDLLIWTLTHRLTSQLDLGLFWSLWTCLGDNCLSYSILSSDLISKFDWLPSLSQCLPHHHTQSDDPNSWPKLAAFSGPAILTPLGYCSRFLPC